MKYEQELQFATELAEKAGVKFREAFDTAPESTWKKDNTPLTHADTAINELIIENIQRAYPEHGVLGEEASYQQDREKLWIVDPIDGTIPFMLGLPLGSISIALAVGGTPKVGVVYEPILNNLYSAVKGGGVFANGKKIQVSDESVIEHNFMCLTSTMASENVTSGEVFDEIEKLGGKALNFRSFAYGASLVATGKFIGAHLGLRSKVWDIAAAKVIVEEAGGKVTDLAGNELRCDREFRGALASNGHMHDELLRLINS